MSIYEMVIFISFLLTGTSIAASLGACSFYSKSDDGAVGYGLAAVLIAAVTLAVTFTMAMAMLNANGIHL